MGTKKLLNTSSSPPIAYKRYSNNSEEQKPLKQQYYQHQQQQPQQQNESNSKSNNNNHNINTTCLLVKQNTNSMFTKLRNYFTQLRTTTSLATQQHFNHHHHQHQRKRHNHHNYRHEKLTECNSIPIVQSTSNMLNLITIVVTLVFLASFNGVASNPVFVDNPSLAQFQSGRNIRHLPCIVRKSGRSGVCMFAIDCIKKNGTHLGTCIDRFYFGSCCDIKEEELTEIADNSIDQNTISHHFTPEASTLPTSALFKLTTLSPLHQHNNTSFTSSSSSSSSISTSSSSSSSSSSLATQQNVTQMLNSVTQSLATTLNDTPRPTTLVTNSHTGKPIKLSTTTKPGQPTTHKQSHFVIRTTAKPTKYTIGAKPSHNTTTKKKTTPSTTTTKKATTTTTATTTTKRPMLTTTEPTQTKDELEETTVPTKLFTYQIVETTAFIATEATNIFDFVTTERGPHRTTKPPQSFTSTTPPKDSTTKEKETTISTTAAATTHRLTTIKPKPQTTRKPTTTKKPTSIKRTTVKPTRRPITTTTTTTTATTPMDVKPHIHNTTTTQTFQTSATSQTQTSTITAGNKTTLAPRPRPKPTASIIKVPKPTTTTTKATPKPTTASTTTTTATTQKTTTEVEKVVPTTTTTSSTTERPTITTTTKTTTTTTTITTPKTTTITTHKTTHKPILSSTTHKPGLVTWTNINGEPVDPNQPIISDWVPVTSEQPLNTHNKVEESSSENVTFEEMDVSVSSSVSAMMNNTTIIISPPHKPVLISKPTSSPSSTSSATVHTTTNAVTTTTDKPITSTFAVTKQPDFTSTTETSSQFSTEGISSSTTTSSSGFTTEEVTTENLNLNSTTTTPITGLEGVDYRQVCGRRMFPEPRIVGGSNAAFGRWPWQISLRQWRTSTYLHKCGAALLNENWAITAAHCVDNVPPSDLLLRLGEYDLAEEEEPYGYQERRVQIVASHPQFDPRTFEYDLALLRFYEPVVFQHNIIPVCVPETDEDFIGQTAFVTGWGRLYEDGPLPSVLQEVAVPVINNTICESMYRAAGYIEHIPHIFICAGWKKGGYDSCEGDSGGPMVLQRESDKRFQLGGVISWGIGCAEANQPGVYTRISEFRDWINQILQF